MSAYQVEVKKNNNENNVSLLRRFSRKVMDTHIIQKVKGSRYNERPPSKLATKNSAIRRLKRRAEYEKLKKLGKVQ
ncbi:MAG: 30S ribosomal protein S21 [Candidatus Pacebacteria bacterium]|nr:30S ribosomal protein S21 [Candidatus Paceibacterota bacterium]MBP9852189.1 30S ribosomal protein S21 [Candidatus Paceibacterota bacterium]